jgi:NAD(P)-dependent dehydrogenase (short-subunit alcohol dehydrogenase family)
MALAPRSLKGQTAGMAKKLENRTALVTGANRGIGLAIAREYAREGAHLLLAGRNLSALEKVCADIGAAGGKAQALEVDLADASSVRRLAEAVKKAVPRLDIFVANAASLGARVPLVRYPLDTWQHTFRVNVEANLILLGALDGHFKASDAARIIMLSANVATQGKATTGSYAVSKAALEAIVRIYVVELAGTPIHVNIISPGPTRTEMRARAAPEENPMSIKPPEDIAPMFVELAMPGCQRQGEWLNADDWLKERARA